MKQSQLAKAKSKGTVLDQIMTWKREEVAKEMAAESQPDVAAQAQLTPPALDLAAALTAEPGASLIAEVKRASPSKGLIAKEWDPAAIAGAYAEAGAAAISCLTDRRFFQGSPEVLRTVKAQLGQINMQRPVLRKDFIYHPYQVYQARMIGADALLLIVSVLSDRELASLYALTERLGMQALVEVHNDQELDRALAINARIIGVNNRDLRTFTVDIENTARLRARIPTDVVVVGESGIRSTDDVVAMAQMGCDAILVGEFFCKAPQVERMTLARTFVEAGRGIIE